MTTVANAREGKKHLKTKEWLPEHYQLTKMLGNNLRILVKPMVNKSN